MNDLILSERDIENLPNHQKRQDRWWSACPNYPHSCDCDDDGFVYWPDKGNYFCRKCHLRGFVNQEVKAQPTKEELAEIARRREEADRDRATKQKRALRVLQSKRKDLVYHQNLNGKTDYVRRKWGLSDVTISQFKVGYCEACPTSSYSDSITIPYYQNNQLINIRHRLNSPNGSGKYRPEIAGLPSSIFNLDFLDDGWTVLVEGEFKTMILWQYGLPAIGIPGTALKDEYIDHLKRSELIYVAFDPGAEVQSLKAMKKLLDSGIEARMVRCPTKPDDFFVIHNGTVGEFCKMLDRAQAYEQALKGDTNRWTRQYAGVFDKLRVN